MTEEQTVEPTTPDELRRTMAQAQRNMEAEMSRFSALLPSAQATAASAALLLDNSSGVALAMLVTDDAGRPQVDMAHMLLEECLTRATQLKHIAARYRIFKADRDSLFKRIRAAARIEALERGAAEQSTDDELEQQDTWGPGAADRLRSAFDSRAGGNK